MTFLLDTQIFLWSAFQSRQLPESARALLASASHAFLFSTTSIWEVAIKSTKRPDVFRVDPVTLRQALLDLGHAELTLTSEHVIHTTNLPLLHKDPFDRIVVAQALVQGVPLATADRQLTLYDASIRYVG